MSFSQRSCYRMRSPMPLLPEAIITGLVPLLRHACRTGFSSVRSACSWAPCPPRRPHQYGCLTAPWRLSRERHFTNNNRVLNRAMWWAGQGDSSRRAVKRWRMVSSSQARAMRWTFRRSGSNLGYVKARAKAPASDNHDAHNCVACAMALPAYWQLCLASPYRTGCHGSCHEVSKA
jgi:hypothetical protein